MYTKESLWKSLFTLGKWEFFKLKENGFANSTEMIFILIRLPKWFILQLCAVCCCWHLSYHFHLEYYYFLIMNRICKRKKTLRVHYFKFKPHSDLLFFWKNDLLVRSNCGVKWKTKHTNENRENKFSFEW